MVDGFYVWSDSTARIFHRARVAPETRTWKVHTVCGKDVRALFTDNRVSVPASLRPCARCFKEAVNGRPQPGVHAENYDPPEGDRYLYLQIGRKGMLRREQLSVGALSTARLAWVARVVLAEMKRRSTT